MKPKFKIEQEVWFVEKLGIYLGIVTRITKTTLKTRYNKITSLCYELNNSRNSFYSSKKETDLFKTQSEARDSLKNTTKISYGNEDA